MDKDKQTHQEKDIQVDNSQSFNIDNSSIFNNDPYFLYVYKKAKKISMAVYMITDFFYETEPLRHEMRREVIKLVGSALSLSSVLSPDRKSFLDGIVRGATSLITFSEVASYSGLESVMNHQILTTELKGLIKTIEDREVPNSLGRNFVLASSFMEDEPKVNNVIQNSSKPAPEVTKVEGKGHQNIGHLKKENVAILDYEPKSRKNERQEAIISIIRKKKEVSIKDLAGVIRGCSEKTIQRELLSLVENGILNKVGERRWSKYSLLS